MSHPDEVIAPSILDIEDLSDDEEENADKAFDADPNEESGSRILKVYALRGDLLKFKQQRELYELDKKRKFKNGISYVHLAALSGNVELLKYLIHDLELNPNIESASNQTALHFAALNGNDDVVRYLAFEIKCSVMVLNSEKATPLHYACLKGMLTTVKLLIDECCAEVTPTALKALPIHYACMGGNAEIVKYLVEEKKCNPKSKASKGLAPMHFACYAGHLEIVSLLAEKYQCLDVVPVKSYLPGHYSPLHLSCLGGHVHVIEYLLTTLHFKQRTRTFTIRLSGIMERATPDHDIQDAAVTIYSLKRLMPLYFRSWTRDEVNSCLNKFDNLGYCKDVNAFVKIAVIGSSGAGKSTLVQVIKRRANNVKVISPMVGRFRSVTELEVKPYTAGIIPTIVEHQECGNIILYDFAGQSNYITSHCAIVPDIVRVSDTVFIVVVNLKCQDEYTYPSLSKWLNICVSEHGANRSLLVVASHIDLMTREEKWKALDRLKSIIGQFHGVKAEVISLDCRKLAGGNFPSLSKALAKACTDIRNDRKVDMTKTLELQCQMLYALLESQDASFHRLDQLLTIVHRSKLYYLPETPEDIQFCLSLLHSRGLIFYLIDDKVIDHSWVITDVAVLLSEVNGKLFAPKNFVEYHDIASNTGIIELSVLMQLFKDYDIQMLKKFLCHLKLCLEMPTNIADYSNLCSLTGDPDEPLLFFPSLIDSKLPELEDQVFQVGFCLVSPHSHYPVTLIHCLLHHFAFNKCFPKTVGTIFNRRCSVWKTGIKWSTTSGLQVIIHVDEDDNSVIILLSHPDQTGLGENLNHLIGDVVKIQLEVCPHLLLEKYMVHPKYLRNAINEPRKVPLFDIVSLASLYKDSRVNQYPVPCNTEDYTRISLQELLPFNYEEILKLLDINEMEILNDLDQVSEASAVVNVTKINDTCSEILQVYSGTLMDSIPDGQKLANDLYSYGLISLSFVDRILTTTAFSRYDVASRVCHEILKLLECHVQPLTVIEKFCSALKMQGDKTVCEIAEDILRNFEQLDV